MHELGICDALLKMVDKAVKEEGCEGVSSITVEVGMLSGVIPHFLSDCWEAVIDGTPYAQTEMIVETLPGIARCLDCGSEFEADVEKLVCPECGGKKLTPVTGRDLTLKEIAAYCTSKCHCHDG